MGADSNKTIREYREKHKRLSDLVNKIKLWPSRTGILHGVREVKKDGDLLIISTHCGCTFKARDSKNGRSIRHLKHRWFKKSCKKCGVPNWKIEKFSTK